MGIEEKLSDMLEAQKKENFGKNAEDGQKSEMQEFQDFTNRINRLKVISNSLYRPIGDHQPVMAYDYQEKTNKEQEREEWEFNRNFNNKKKLFEQVGISSPEELVAHEEFKAEEDVVRYTQSKEKTEDLNKANEKMLEVIKELGVPVENLKAGDYDAIKSAINRFVLEEIDKKEEPIVDDMMNESAINGLKEYIGMNQGIYHYADLLDKSKPNGNYKRFTAVESFVSDKTRKLNTANKALEEIAQTAVSSEIQPEEKVIFDYHKFTFPQLEQRNGVLDKKIEEKSNQVKNMKTWVEAKEQEFNNKGALSKMLSSLGKEIRGVKDNILKAEDTLQKDIEEQKALRKLMDIKLNSLEGFDFSGAWQDFLKQAQKRSEEKAKNNRLSQNEEKINAFKGLKYN